MVQLLGWIGFLLLAGALILPILRRLHIEQMKTQCIIYYHRSLALAALGVLTLHGLWALSGGRGWRRGFWSHHFDGIVYGAITWLLLFAICILALYTYRQKSFSHKHCWLVGLLGLFVLLHVF